MAPAARRDGAGWGRQLPAAPPPHASPSPTVLGTGVQLNGESLDPAHGPVAEAAARVMSRSRLVVVEKSRLAAAGGAAHACKAPMDGSRLG